MPLPCSVLDVCAKAGQPETVQQLMEVGGWGAAQAKEQLQWLVRCQGGERTMSRRWGLDAVLLGEESEGGGRGGGPSSCSSCCFVRSSLLHCPTSRSPSLPIHPATPCKQDMTAAGSKPDSVTHTILLMAHEKVRWHSAAQRGAAQKACRALWR